MRTLIIGDLHLQAGLIFPWIKSEFIESKSIDQIIFIGDYFDQWGQCGNDALYLAELKTLVNFKTYCELNNVKTVWLIGNHDAPYILNRPEIYSSEDRIVRERIQDAFRIDLKPTITYEVDGYQLSHAGIASPNPYRNIDWTTPVGYIELKHLNDADGLGVNDELASPLWLRPSTLCKLSNPYYTKQIFGHTPVRTVQRESNIIEAWNVDTFSLTRGLVPIGDGSVLILDNGKISKDYFPDWQGDAMYNRRLVHLKNL